MPEMHIIARIRNAYTEKFTVPRQSGLVPEVVSDIVFEPPYRVRDAFRGLEGFSHVWLIWLFDRSERAEWSATVRPPRLGGNVRMGVFATRSPFRPNAIGLSCVRLMEVRPDDPDGAILRVAGADLMNGTPILDIKPYLPYTDCIQDALSGFTAPLGDRRLQVDCPEELLHDMPRETRSGLLAVLSRDPRPGYQKDPERVYGVRFGEWNVRFTVPEDDRLRVLTVDRET